jgi:hypothetical protein
MIECPGRHKCHGPVSFCDECGDVDLICDDPCCDVHSRGHEREAAWIKARNERDAAEAIAEDARKIASEKLASWVRWRNGNPVMVARKASL